MRINLKQLENQGFDVHRINENEIEIHFGPETSDFWDGLRDHMRKLDLNPAQAARLAEELYEPIETHMILLGIKGELP